MDFMQASNRRRFELFALLPLLPCCPARVHQEGSRGHEWQEVSAWLGKRRPDDAWVGPMQPNNRIFKNYRIDSWSKLEWPFVSVGHSFAIPPLRRVLQFQALLSSAWQLLPFPPLQLGLALLLDGRGRQITEADKAAVAHGLFQMLKAVAPKDGLERNETVWFSVLQCWCRPILTYLIKLWWFQHVSNYANMSGGGSRSCQLNS